MWGWKMQISRSITFSHKIHPPRQRCHYSVAVCENTEKHLPMEAETAIRLINAIKRNQDIASLHFWLIYKEYERCKKVVDAWRKQVELREKELDQGIGSKRKMLDNQKKQNEMIILELQKADETFMRLAEKCNREKELVLKNIMEVTAEVVQNVLELQLFKDDDAEIYVKRMEKLGREQFMNAVKVKYGSADLEKAVELCSLWEGYLKDPSWHPYKVVMVGDKDKEVLDENDDKLKELKNEFGEEVYEVVTEALNKFNEDNPSARYAVLELCNTSKKRKAAFKEGVARLLNDWKIQRGKRKRN